ncbi:MAG: acyl-CoA dehydrogenase protein [Candidatus Angelobacter sp.]|nr:acyl-CoA dehydrogenase protein [Candidatus Angelobacter sp.]
MADRTFLNWPFFDDSHRGLADNLEDWCEREREFFAQSHQDLDAACRSIVTKLGDAGWLRYAVPKAYGGATENLDVRSLCIIRETLGRRSGLVEFCFALQGLGVGPITQFGADALKSKYLPNVAAGKKIAALAISEKEAGSDVSAMRTIARRDGDGFVIDGEKTWISNAGIADHYVVFCRFPEAGEKSFIALVVDSSNPGLKVAERIEVIAPHPLGTVVLNKCRVPASSVVGEAGNGIKVAFATLDIFRSTVGAAALGLARRALDESIAYANSRRQFGQTLGSFQMTQAKIAEMAMNIDASALLVYRAAWMRDTGAKRITREAAMAKLFATESAQKIIDDAVQLFGGRGVVVGEPVERLYREIRALRIYEGTSEIQKLVIAGSVLNSKAKAEEGKT